MNCTGPRRGNESIRRSTHRGPFGRSMPSSLSLALAGVLLAVLLGGCASGTRTTGDAGGSANSTRTTSTTANTSTNTNIDYPSELEAAYLIGPSAARDMGARISWQKRLASAERGGIKQISMQGDSVFVLEGGNLLSRLNRESGERIWTMAVGGRIDEVQGTIYLPEEERLLVAVADSLIVVDSTVGSITARQRFSRLASTPPVLFGSNILYGSINGQLVWHSFTVGTQWRAYQVSDSITTKPVLEGNVVVVAGADGTIMALNASAATQLWSQRLLDEVVAAPVIGNGAVFVAGMDQSLRAFELGNGRGIWRYRTESPLSTSPTLIEDRVFQFVPGKGLVCLEAVPLDVPAGSVIWESAEVTGRVIVERRDTLYVWDHARRTLTLVSSGSGTVINKISLPDVNHLMATELDGGDLFAASDDGRVIHLRWRS